MCYYIVGPHEGTWIEIIKLNYKRRERIVVPHEGTWIEIAYSTSYSILPPSFPTRERGLKL